MANHRGWWEIKFSNVDNDDEIELSDADLEHVAGLIKDGFLAGEVTKDEENGGVE